MICLPSNYETNSRICVKTFEKEDRLKHKFLNRIVYKICKDKGRKKQLNRNFNLNAFLVFGGVNFNANDDVFQRNRKSIGFSKTENTDIKDQQWPTEKHIS